MSTSFVQKTVRIPQVESIYEKTAVTATTTSGPANYIWEDENLDRIIPQTRGTHRGQILIELGECMMIMATIGPVKKFGETVAILASHLREPNDMSDAFSILEDDVKESGKPLTSLIDGAKLSTIQKTCRYDCFTLFDTGKLPESFKREADAITENYMNDDEGDKELEEAMKEREKHHLRQTIDDDDNSSVYSAFSNIGGNAEESAAAKLVDFASTKGPSNSTPPLNISAADVEREKEMGTQDLQKAATPDKNKSPDGNDRSPNVNEGESSDLKDNEPTDHRKSQEENPSSPKLPIYTSKANLTLLNQQLIDGYDTVKDIDDVIKGGLQGTNDPRVIAAAHIERVFLSGQFRNPFILLCNLFEKVRHWDEEMQIALYCFLAASLVRSGVKSYDSVTTNWQKAKDRFAKFYDIEYIDNALPIITKTAYTTLRNVFEPGRPLLRIVLKLYLKLRYSTAVSVQMRGILDYTILIQYSYNGMGMISLTIALCAVQNEPDARHVLLQFECEGTRNSIAAILSYMTTYKEQGEFGIGQFAPWSRAIDNNYWSRLTPRNHQFLATGLMVFLEPVQTSIWSMVGFKRDEKAKYAFETIRSLRDEAVLKEKTSGAIDRRSMFHRFGDEIARRGIFENQPKNVDLYDRTPESEEVDNESDSDVSVGVFARP